MPGFVDTLIASFKQTLNLQLWLYFFAIQLLEGIITGVVFLLLALIGFLALLGPIISIGGFENIELLFSDPGILTSIVSVACVLFLVFVVVTSFIVSLFTGIRFHLFNEFLRTKRLDLSSAFEKARPRFFTYFKVSLLVGVIISIALAIAFVPLLLSIPFAGTTAPNIGPLIAGAGLFIVLLLIIVIALFLLSPMLNLLAPVAFFERRNVVDSIKRAFELMKANYLGNLAYVILYSIIVMAISFVISMIVQFLQLAVMLPAMVAGSSAGAAVGGLVALVVLVLIVLYVPFTVWSVFFDTACFRNLYFLDLALLGRPVGKTRTKRLVRKRKTK